MAIDVAVKLSLTEDEALALAQFVKRVDRETAARHAGDQAEADAIYDAFYRVREGLAEAGFAPR